MPACGRTLAAFLVVAAATVFGSCSRTEPPWEELVSTVENDADRRRVAAALAARPGANLLLITIDTCRSDRISSYGNHRIRTPNLDALAARGVQFADAICQAPITLPSHCSIMTGLNPTAHGVRDNGRFTLDDAATTLAEVLQERGYETAAFVGAFPVLAKFGLAQGFETYSDEFAARRVRGHGVIRERRAGEVTSKAIAWLSRSAGRPFFAWVHYFDPHWPYEPPEIFGAQYPLFPYDGEIAYVDAEIGRLLDALAERGIAENTIVVATSDHGEGLGEHKELSHSVLVYDGAMRVPLIVAPASRSESAHDSARDARDSKDPRGGILVASQVRTIDIMPTMLNLAGVDLPHGLDGVALRDETGAPLPPEAGVCYMESYASWYGFQWSPLRALRTSNWKFVEAPKSELYDLAADPREERNLLVSNARSGAPWRAALAQIAVERGLSAEADMDAETVEGLRALGYIGVGRSLDSPRPKGADPDLPNPSDMIGLYFAYFSPALEKFMRGDYPGAIASAKEGLASDSTNVQGLITLGHAQHRMGLAADARATYSRVLVLDPFNSGAHFMLGAIAHAEGDDADAEREYRAALEIDPTIHEARHDLAVVLMKGRRNEEAEKLLLGVIAEDSLFAGAHRTLGNLYAATDRKAAAFAAYVNCLIANPNNREIETVVLGYAADAVLGDEMLEALHGAWRSGRRDEGFAVAFAEIAFARGRKELARSVVGEQMAIVPTPRLYRVRAWMHKSDGRGDLAEKDLAAAVAIDPDDVDARANLAAYYRAAGRWDEARREYEECLAIDPRHDTALVGLGIIFAESQQLGRAIELWERAVRSNPNSPAKTNLEAARRMLGEEGAGT
ncbi:MAG: tetratricopeptide repeat protein [bacterium]